MSTTAVILVGNTDDKLTQSDWAAYCTAVDEAVDSAWDNGAQVHFRGAPYAAAPWQNMAWAVLLPADPGVRDALRERLCALAGAYRQDSIAWVEAEPEFLTPGGPAPVSMS